MKRIQMLSLYMCLISVLMCGSVKTSGQEHRLVYTASFTRLLDRTGIEFYEPVENWLHVVPEREDGIMKYDLVLQNDRNDFEVRYRIRDMAGRSGRIPQGIEVHRLLASIASNDENAIIKVQVPDSEDLQADYNADEGMFATFTPKYSFSEKPMGTLISLYAIDRVAVDIVLLYYDQEYSPVESFGNIRFR